MLQVLAMRAGATERSLSATKPWLDMQLPDGSRLTVVYQVAVKPYVTIRRHTLMDVTLEDLRDRFGGLDDLICGFLKAAMAAGLNIMVAGLADAGKTTMLRALASEIPKREQFVVLEESRELGLHTTGRHPWAMSLESREGHGARGADGRPAGEVTIADLIPLTLRMSVQRIIVGEVRSREIVPMLQAMATSKGSMCTIHARDPRSVMDRVIELALQHGAEMKADLARRMAAGAIDLILYLTVEDETKLGGRKHRYVSEIVEVQGMTDDRLVTTTIFGPGPDGRAVPRHQPERLLGQLLRVGYDPRILTGYIQQGEHNRGAWTHELQRVRRA
jgi:Flp pilus assembly CpaF family ATPase